MEVQEMEFEKMTGTDRSYQAATEMALCSGGHSDRLTLGAEEVVEVVKILSRDGVREMETSMGL